ncbi:WXG100 family type VII secretion target [Qaidamihabitans albus]|uniref:WXG100 family type VII secretion target n=1 Tax=Qaidamihabitans albus TaxID=2795733 RepID=UPI0018F27776|nr:WXG100 family type VII secretion target [Qaidamihabitans albus]
MSRITYNVGAIGEVGSSATSISAQMQALFDDLMTRAKSIVGEGWQGGAALGFQEAHTKWDAAAKKLSDAENRCGIATQNAATDMHATDNKCAGLFV